MMGLQDDGTWVLGQTMFFDSNGSAINPDESQSVWIGHLYKGPGIAPDNSGCKIPLPLDGTSMKPMLVLLKNVLIHNYFPSLLVIGGCLMAFHYSTLIESLRHCPVPLAFGPSGTGKTTALSCGLAVVGSYPNRFYSHASKEKYVQLCTNSCLPLGIDDPQSKTAIGELCISLFNGAKGATIGRGEFSPTCMAVLAANFIAPEKER